MSQYIQDARIKNVDIKPPSLPSNLEKIYNVELRLVIKLSFNFIF